MIYLLYGFIAVFVDAQLMEDKHQKDVKSYKELKRKERESNINILRKAK